MTQMAAMGQVELCVDTNECQAGFADRADTGEIGLWPASWVSTTSACHAEEAARF
jgi:hypothetical protein